jgi:hypothetical protein
MQNIELIPTRTPDGSIVLRAVGMGRGERLRRFAAACCGATSFSAQAAAEATTASASVPCSAQEAAWNGSEPPAAERPSVGGHSAHGGSGGSHGTGPRGRRRALRQALVRPVVHFEVHRMRHVE